MGDRGLAAELTTALAAVPRSEGWGHCWADAFLSGPLGQVTRLGARDPGWPECWVPGERLRGSQGAVLVMGSEVFLWGPGARPAHQMALFMQECWLPERKALKSSQLAWLSSPWCCFCWKIFPQAPWAWPGAAGAWWIRTSGLGAFLWA